MYHDERSDYLHDAKVSIGFANRSQDNPAEITAWAMLAVAETFVGLVELMQKHWLNDAYQEDRDPLWGCICEICAEPATVEFAGEFFCTHHNPNKKVE